MNPYNEEASLEQGVNVKVKYVLLLLILVPLMAWFLLKWLTSYIWKDYLIIILIDFLGSMMMLVYWLRNKQGLIFRLVNIRRVFYVTFYPCNVAIFYLVDPGNMKTILVMMVGETLILLKRMGLSTLYGK